MSDTKENDPTEVLKMQAPDPVAMQKEIAELRAALARKEADRVLEHRFRELPKYFLNDGVFLEDVYYPKGCVIEWDGEPNQEMVPQNEPATARMKAFLEHVTYGAMEVARMRGRNFYGLTTDRNVLLDQYRADVQREMAEPVAPVIQMPVRRDEVPVMPTTDAAIAAARRNPKTNSKVGKVEMPAPKTDRGTGMAPAIVGRGVA